MKPYELVVLVDPRLTQDELKGVLKDVEDLTNGGIVSTDDMGLQQLQHEIHGKKALYQAFMVSYHVSLDPQKIAEIKTQLSYMKGVLRYVFFAMKENETFLTYEEVKAKAQELADSDQWVMKKRVSLFDAKANEELFNWKATPLLQKFTTRFGDIKPRKYTGITVKQQKAIRIAIIRSRELGMVPFIK